MTSKEKKRILLRYGEIDRYIDELESELAYWRSRVTSTSPVISDMPKGGSADGTKLEKSVEKIIKLEKQIDDEINKLVNLRNTILSAIQALPDEREQKVLRLAYIGKAGAGGYKRLKLWQISREMNYSYDRIRHIHGMALLHLNFKS